jgi:hypothetical protein
MENKITAVEWLKENLPSLFTDDSGYYRKLFEQAKAMEKEQIIDSFDEARTYVLKNVWKHDDGIRYYENKYGEDPNRS